MLNTDAKRITAAQITPKCNQEHQKQHHAAVMCVKLHDDCVGLGLEMIQHNGGLVNVRRKEKNAKRQWRRTSAFACGKLPPSLIEKQRSYKLHCM
jgi:hypothetical protein